MPCDPITLEILRGAIRAAHAEMEALLERTAISAFIREKKDFYTALFDAEGRLAVGSNVPIFGNVTAPVLARLAAAKGIDMPIVAAVARLLDCSASVDQVLEALLSRPPRPESH